ncbi:MAG: CBS domain-containing protein, partial [Bacteroidia bacterium]|nr:CBS domain-containing protein [Bacteroidia bacterium]
MRVGEIMNSPVVFTQKTIKVSSLKDMLSRKGITAVPVIEDDGTIAGIVSSSDIISGHDENKSVMEV